MPTAKESGGGTFVPAPDGTHIARCFACISLGTQQPNNPGFNPAFKVMLLWELGNELVEGTDDPMTIGKEYTCSLSEKANLRKDLEGWRGRQFNEAELAGFDVVNVVGQPCVISVIHAKSAKGSTYAKINSISKLPKGMTCPPQVHKTVVYEIEHGRNEVFGALPEWIQKKINACDEWQKPAPSKANPAPVAEVVQPDSEGDDVPF